MIFLTPQPNLRLPATNWPRPKNEFLAALDLSHTAIESSDLQLRSCHASYSSQLPELASHYPLRTPITLPLFAKKPKNCETKPSMDELILCTDNEQWMDWLPTSVLCLPRVLRRDISKNLPVKEPLSLLLDRHVFFPNCGAGGDSKAH